MENFFASLADRWPAGRQAYHWRVLPGTELLRDHLARPYAERTSRPGFVPVESEPLRAWLSDCETAGSPVPVTRLVLVAQRHDGREIRLRALGEIPLTGERL